MTKSPVLLIHTPKTESKAFTLRYSSPKSQEDLAFSGEKKTVVPGQKPTTESSQITTQGRNRTTAPALLPWISPFIVFVSEQTKATEKMSESIRFGDLNLIWILPLSRHSCSQTVPCVKQIKKRITNSLFCLLPVIFTVKKKSIWIIFYHGKWLQFIMPEILLSTFHCFKRPKILQFL